jgi:two-component system, cell cycle response regulator
MDLLVKGALHVQRGLTLGLGSAVGVLGAIGLVLAPPHWIDTLFGRGLALLYGVSLVWRVVRRYASADTAQFARRELELGIHLVTLVYALIDHLPNNFQGPYQALSYALISCTAGLLSTRAALGCLILALGLEFALAFGVRGLSLAVVGPHAALLVAFAGMNWLVLRGEIRRVRQLSKQRVESELLRLKEAARNYRLTGVPKSAADGAASKVSAPPGDEDRLVHSSLEHLRGNLRFVLLLLQKCLGLRTVALLWLDNSEHRLRLREALSTHGELESGPFGVKEGIFGAALSSQRLVTIDEAKALGRMPLLPRGATSGAISAMPVLEHGNAVGVLLVETEPGFAPHADLQRLLSDATHYALRVIESERLFVGLQRAKTEQGKLYQAADMLAGARSEVSVIRAGVDAARQFASFDFAAVTLFHEATQSHEICAVSGVGAGELVGAMFPHNGGLVAMVVENQHPLPYRGEYHRSRQVVFSQELGFAEMPSLIILPLKVHDAALGTLVLGSNTAHAFGEDVRPTLEVLARHTAVSLANARMMKRLEDLATTDGLTGLLNKRALTEVARQKIRSAQRFKKPLSLIVGDIDHFKRVNDTYGHDVGDVVIQGFGQVLQRSKRATDAVGRFGGEEFVLVCEETDAQGAELLAERIRTELSQVKFQTPQGTVSVTCSLGISTLPQAGHDWESLFKATDEALYASKRGGRNRATLWTPSLRGAAA